MGKKILGYDFNIPSQDGTDNVTTALRELLNSFPLLEDDEEIAYNTLENDSGIGMFPTSSVAILTEKESVTGHVTQVCAYPFVVVARSKGLNENRKANQKEWLDDLGRWLEKQEVKGYKLEKYPYLTETKKFEKISRASQSYLYGTGEDKSEDWAISIQATYKNEFDR